MVKFKETNEKIPDDQKDDKLPDELPMDIELKEDEKLKMFRKGYYTIRQNADTLENIIRKYLRKIRAKIGLGKN